MSTAASDLKNVTPLRQPVEETRDLRSEIRTLQTREARLTQAVISRESGVGGSALNRWLKGVYEGDNAAIELKLARWIDSYNLRSLEERALPAAPEWVETPSSMRVLAALAYAQIAGDIAIIYGGAGVGKTSAARHYGQTSPNVWIATMTPATASVVPALEEVAIAIGLRETVSGGGGARLQRAIVSRITGTRGLLIVDEAQHLATSALDSIRSLHDATGIGVALLGNERAYARMFGQQAPYLDRLWSRIGKRVRLQQPSEHDIAEIANAWKIRDVGVKRQLAEISQQAGAGGLRLVTKVLRIASVTAAKRRGGIAAADVKAAWADLGGAGGAQ